MEPLDRLLARGLKVFCEGANVPATRGALHRFEAAGILIGPVRAANSGGVAVSGLEQSQSSRRIAWSHEGVDRRLQEIVRRIRAECVKYGESNGRVDCVEGAKIADFVEVADAMLAYSIV